MDVHFRNSYGPRIWVAIMRYDPDACPGEYGSWATEGWWGMNEGEEVFAFSTSNRFAAYFAKAEDGAFWSGNYGPVYVYHQAWSSCVDIGSTGAYGTVDMRLIDTDDADKYTVNLVR
jgi:Protein of unknown function (DUF1036)